MIPGLRMPDPARMPNSAIEDAIYGLDLHWDKLIELSKQHGNESIMWLEEYYASLVDELCKRGLRRRPLSIFDA